MLVTLYYWSQNFFVRSFLSRFFSLPIFLNNKTSNQDRQKLLLENKYCILSHFSLRSFFRFLNSAYNLPIWPPLPISESVFFSLFFWFPLLFFFLFSFSHFYILSYSFLFFFVLIWCFCLFFSLSYIWQYLSSSVINSVMRGFPRFLASFYVRSRLGPDWDPRAGQIFVFFIAFCYWNMSID